MKNISTSNNISGSDIYIPTSGTYGLNNISNVTYSTKGNGNLQKTNTFNRSNLKEKFNYQPQTKKYKSLFDREGNPFKYFMDFKKNLKSNSGSLISSQLEYQKNNHSSSNKHNSNTDTNTHNTGNNLNSNSLNNTNICVNNLSQSHAIKNEINSKCHDCVECFENYNKLSEKIIQFLSEKLKFENIQNDEKIIDDLKNFLKNEMMNIQISNQNPNGPNRPNSPNSPNRTINNISENSNLNKKEIIFDKANNNQNLNNIKTITTSPKNIQEQPKKIMLTNIKEIIKNNKNSRNHKDIILEDYQTDSNKYNLNELGKSRTLNSNSTKNNNNNNNQNVKPENKQLNNYTNIMNNINIAKKISPPPNMNYRKRNFNNNYNNNLVTNNSNNKIRVNATSNVSHITPKVSSNILKPLSQNSIRKKVKSFSPKYKNNNIMNKISCVNKGTTSNSRDKSLKNIKYSYDYKKIGDKSTTGGTTTCLNTEANSKDLKPRTRNQFPVNLNKASTLGNNYNIIENINTNSSICDALKRPFNISDIYNKILSMNNKNKYSILKNWYNEKTNFNEINRYMATEGTNKNADKNIEKNTEENNTANNNYNCNKIQNSPLPPKIEKVNTITNKKATNFEKFKNNKVLKKENCININNTTTTGKTLSHSNMYPQLGIKKNQKLKNNSNSEANFNFSQKGNTMIFNNNYFNNINNYNSDAKISSNENVSNVEKINYDLGVLNNKKNLLIQDNDSPDKQTEQIPNPKELMKEIKLNLDENYKNFFNFSYDNYLSKDLSESIPTNSDEVLNTQESVGTNAGIGGPNLNSNNKENPLINIYTNEISFDDQENRIKNLICGKK